MNSNANRRRRNRGTRPYIGAADIDAEIDDEYEQDRETGGQLREEVEESSARRVPHAANNGRRRRRVAYDDDVSILKRTLNQLEGYKIGHFFITLPKFLTVATFRIIEVAVLLLLELASKFMPKKVIDKIKAYKDPITKLMTWFVIILFLALIVKSSLFSNGGGAGYDEIETSQPYRELPSLPPPRRPAQASEDLSEELRRLEDDTRSIWLEISDHHSHLKSIKQSLDFIMFNQDTQKDLLATLDLSSEQVSELILQILQNASFWNNFFQQVQEYTATTDYPTTTVTAIKTITKENTVLQDHPVEKENGSTQQQNGGSSREEKPLMELLSKTINDIVHKNMVESIDSAITKYHHQNLMPLLPKIITNVVESELTKYHQDVLDTADFALRSRGGRIIHSFTTSTYHALPAWLQSIRHAAAIRDGFSKPEMAIFHDIHAGQCWSMRGTKGTLGILLSEPIYVKAITVEHPSKEVLLKKMNYAPKEMELFGIPKYPSKTENLVSLVKFEYDIHAQKHQQTFQVPAKEDELTEEGDRTTSENNVFKAVVLKVYSNWGHEDYTDIYRVRIHGEPVSQN